MLKYFICPDGSKIEIAQCLDRCPRPEGRCLSLPTLHSVGSTRPWKGKPSTTQLLNPTRQEFLKITKDYAINPFDMAFALLGTRHHSRLEIVAKKLKGVNAELYLEADTTGILDLLEPDPQIEDHFILFDYKTWGSFAVAKHISKTNGYYEKWQAELQLNNYRWMAEQLGFAISKMFIQVTVRDGGTFTARNNGIEEKMLVLPINRLEDNVVREYFLTKSFRLIQYVDNDIMPNLCDYEERWNGRRCKGSLCEVHMFCPEGAKVNKVELEV